MRVVPLKDSTSLQLNSPPAPAPSLPSHHPCWPRCWDRWCTPSSPLHFQAPASVSFPFHFPVPESTEYPFPLSSAPAHWVSLPTFLGQSLFIKGSKALFYIVCWFTEFPCHAASHPDKTWRQLYLFFLSCNKLQSIYRGILDIIVFLPYIFSWNSHGMKTT